MAKPSRTELIRMYAELGTLTEIAKKYQVTVTSVARWMKSHNIEYRHTSYINGKTHNAAGYILVFVGKGKPGTTKSGYAYEHRVVMEEVLGRPLDGDEVVHHINGDKTDNRPENLCVTKRGLHGGFHTGMKSITLDKAAMVLELATKGYLIESISQIVGLSEPTINKILNEYNAEITCPECQRTFLTRKGFSVHVRMTHPKSELYFVEK